MLKQFSFPKQARLLTASQFQQVFGNRLAVSGKELLLVANSNNESTARLGLAIKRKDIKKAVHRNTIKRIIRESFRLNRMKLHHLDIVVVSRPSLLHLTPSELRELIDKQWLCLQERYQKSLATV